MEFTSLSIEACEPASDGGVVPGLVPIPNVDPDALEEAAEKFRTIGEAIGESGEGITSTWASLTGVYVAPEADTLLSTLDPVSADGASVATGVRDAASALEAFAETARELKSRLTGLKTEVEAFRADVGWDEEWLEDEDERERNNDLNNRIATAVHEYQEAERDCANKIGQHYGGTFFTGHSDKANHDQASTSGDRDWQVYGTASARTDQANPWGSPVDAPTSAFEDAFWGLADVVTGAVVGLGVATGLYRDGQFAYPLGTEHGQNLLTNWEEAKGGFWALLGSDAQGEWAFPGGADAQYHNARGPWIEQGDSIVPVSEWEERPAYTIFNGAGNLALMASPVGLARTFLDAPDLDAGSGTGLDGDGSGNGSSPTERGPNGVSPNGGGLHGTDTVGMHSDSPTAGQPEPGTTIGGMRDSLADLQGQLDGNPSPEGPPTDSPSPIPENPTPSPTDTPPAEEGAASENRSDPTAHELHENTPGSSADNSSDPWATSPVDDGSTTGQESPTTPVADPTDTDGSTTDDFGAGTNPNGEHSTQRDDDAPAPTDSGDGHGGSGDDDGSGAPPGSPDPDDDASESQGSGDENEDEGDFLVPDTSSEPDTDVPLQERTLDRTSSDPTVQALIPEKGQRFGDGVTLEPNTHYTLLETDGQRFTEYITDGEGEIREIRASSEGWEAKHPEFLNPRPDMTYVVDDRYTFRTDEHSRTASAEGTIIQEKNDRNGSRQDKVGDSGENYFQALNEQIRNDFYAVEGRDPEPGEVPQYEEVEYQGGHMIGSQFFGIGEELNMVPMRYDINQNRTATAFHDRNPEELGGIEGSFANVERTWRGILTHKEKWHNFNNEKFNIDDSWKDALKLNPKKPKIDVKITNAYDPT